MKKVRTLFLALLSPFLLVALAFSALAETVRVGGTGASLASMRMLADAFEAQNPDIKIEVLPSLGSGGCIRALTDGALDLSMSARPLTEKEAAAGLTSTVYARTPLVVIANRSDVRDAVSYDDLVAMYTGEMTAWHDGTRVRIVTRQPSETDAQVQRGFSPEMAVAVDALMQREGLIVARNDQLNADFVETTLGAMGVATLAQVVAEDRDVKVLTLEGITPDANLAADSDNAFAKTFRVVLREDVPAPAQQFLAFIFSPAGRDILKAPAHFVGTEVAS